MRLCIYEIPNQLSWASKAIFVLFSILKSSFLSRKTKLIVYKTVINPAIIYGSEALPLVKTGEYKITIFERKVLSSIR